MDANTQSASAGIKRSGSDVVDEVTTVTSAPQKKVRSHGPTSEEVKPDSVTSQKEEQQPSERQRVLVEFKFRSYKTQLFKEGGLKGTLHVEMDQDQESGIYSIPVGETSFRVKLEDVKTESWCMGDGGWDEFSGTFSRKDSNGPIDMDPGLILDYCTGNHRDFKTTVRPPNAARRMYPGYREIKESGSEPFVARGLSNWEEGQGGFLELIASVSTEWRNDVRWGWYGGTYPETRAAEGTYKIKLYTVLSAHRPNEGEDSLPKYTSGKFPDWDALVHVVAARNPDKSASWAERAVRQYRYFMDLKVDPKLAKQKFSPSLLIDDIWHAHLSFTERYQHDIVSLTKGNGIVEHLPVHLKRSAEYYKKAHAQHLKRMKKLGRAVDEEFWPDPLPYDPSEHENSSDDEKMKGYLADGKPSYSGPKNSGCGGCG